LAAKYEEIYPPELRELVYITDRAYNKEEILEMEVDIVTCLNYNCTVPTAHTFLCRYLKAAHADRTMVQLACYLAERSLQELSSIKFLPSTIAATAILLSRKTLQRHPWSPTLLKYTLLDEDDIAPCVEDMRSYLENSESSQQQAVFRKYSGPKFGAVAKLEIKF
jgi:cyclin B